MFGPEVGGQEGTEEVEGAQRQQRQVVDPLDTAHVPLLGHAIAAGHHPRHHREEEGDPHLHCNGEGNGNPDRHIRLDPGGDGEGGADYGADNDVGRLRPRQRGQPHPDQLQGTAHQNASGQVAEDEANQRPQHHGTVEVGQTVEQVESGEKRQDAKQQTL